MKKIFVIVICLFFLNACSIKVAYRFLGIIGKWHIGTYVSLEGPQKQLVDTMLDNFHDWHRSTQLSIYANYLDQVIPHLESEKITGEWIHQQTDIVQDMLDVSMIQLKPQITELMASFSDKQVEEIIKSLKKDRKKYRKKYVDTSEKKQSKRRKQQLLDYAGRFFGRLTPQQKVWLDEWEQSLWDYEVLTLQQQEILANKVEGTLALRKNREKLSPLVDEIIFYRSEKWEKDLQDVIDHNQVLTYELLAKLINSQTEKQRDKMLRKLRSYRDDCISLAKSK